MRSTKKIYGIMLLVMLVVMVAVPLSAIPPASPEEPSGDLKGSYPGGEEFRVYITASKKVEKVSSFDYVVGVVSAEMGPDAPVEALKAQSVAGYTFARYRKLKNKGKEYDLTDSPNTDQKYLSRSQLKKKWGKSYDKKIKTVEEAVRQSAGYLLTDEKGAPIFAAYHALSGGRTESSKTVWGKDYSYLQPVESIGDLLSPDYLSVRKFTQEELKEKLSSKVTLTGDPKNWIADIDCSSSGTVISANMCGTSITGEQLRILLELRSACFEATYADGMFTFNVKGWGHGVGMSQYGACYLARTGSTFIEILSHYYTDCKMTKI